jgi:hypothetical protein
MSGLLSRKAWSPYVAGAGLGVIAAVSIALLGRPLGASGAYQNLASYAGKELFPQNIFFSTIMPARVEWQAYVLAGVFLGAMAASMLSHDFRLRWMPEEGWRERFGPRPYVRWAILFFGAFLVELGAAIAGGCTSGLAISGGVVLSPGAFVFMAAMFAAGIPAALLVARRNKR